MKRPALFLTALTSARLDAAGALGVRETWIDQDELRLPEPSPLGRWLCVLEWQGVPLQAAGSSECEDPSIGSERAAQAALMRLARLAAPIDGSAGDEQAAPARDRSLAGSRALTGRGRS